MERKPQQEGRNVVMDGSTSLTRRAAFQKISSSSHTALLYITRGKSRHGMGGGRTEEGGGVGRVRLGNRHTQWGGVEIKLDRDEERERNSLLEVRRGFLRRFDMTGDLFTHAPAIKLNRKQSLITQMTYHTHTAVLAHGVQQTQCRPWKFAMGAV